MEFSGGASSKGCFSVWSFLPRTVFALLFAPCLWAASDAEQAFSPSQQKSLQGWVRVFNDSGSEDWRERWFLDGDKAVVLNDEEKMTLDSAKGFAVLWTKQEFSGDLRIEYDFLRADDHNAGVNILYIQARGSGKGGYHSDISRWSDKRKNAAMQDYFAHMHTYHISYATDGDDYIRARRYMPERWWVPEPLRLAGTEISGSLSKAGIFNDKQWIHVTIEKTAKEIKAEFAHPSKTLHAHFQNTDKPGIKAGRVGLRLMPKRLSYFKNIEIFTTPTASQQRLGVR